MSDGKTKSRDNVDWLDYARFLAAFIVMAFHYLANGPRHGKTGAATDFGLIGQVAEYGYLGVDLFFIISGFVIFWSAIGRPADRFAVSRASRLWMTFAVCMTFTAVIETLTRTDPVTPLRYLVNLTMIPDWLGQKSVDGVYWTLAVEIAFYGAVFLAIVLGLTRRPALLIAGWVGVMVAARIAGMIFGFEPPMLLGGYFPLFASGCILALLRQDGAPRWLWLVLLANLPLVALLVHHAAVGYKDDGGVIPMVAVAIVLAFHLPFILLRKTSLRLPMARAIGDLTYPLYLLHAGVGYLAIAALPVNKWLAVTIVMAGAILLAHLVNRFVERPTLGLRNRAFDRLLGAPIRFVLGRLPRRGEA
jgi:peptidoglycan/LPS O-acetylase OafA/YrhL